MFRTPELEENKAIHQIWRNFNQVTHKEGEPTGSILND